MADVEKIAEAALKAFEGRESFFGSERVYLAFMGVMEGIKTGRIVTGQESIGRMLAGEFQSEKQKSERSMSFLSKEERELVVSIFASGICSAGCRLDGAKEQSWSSRERP